MAKTYQISLDGNGSAKPVRLLSYKYDDGNFVGNSPNTYEQKCVLELCKLLFIEMSPYGKLEIEIKKTD